MRLTLKRNNQLKSDSNYREGKTEEEEIYKVTISHFQIKEGNIKKKIKSGLKNHKGNHENTNTEGKHIKKIKANTDHRLKENKKKQ